MFTISELYTKMTFGQMPDGSYFDNDGKVFRKVRWKEESAYGLDCESGIIMMIPVGDEFYMLELEREVNMKFRRVPVPSI